MIIIIFNSYQPDGRSAIWKRTLNRGDDEDFTLQRASFGEEDITSVKPFNR